LADLQSSSDEYIVKDKEIAKLEKEEAIEDEEDEAEERSKKAKSIKKRRKSGNKGINTTRKEEIMVVPETEEESDYEYETQNASPLATHQTNVLRQFEEDSDDDLELDEESITRDAVFTGIYIRKVMKDGKDLKGRDKKNTRVFNSYQFCYYCGQLKSNFAQHASSVHSKEEEVIDIKATPLQAKKKWAVLRAKGNHIHNLATIERKKGEVILDRRPLGKFDLSQYGPCPRCLTWMSKKLMWKHMRCCPVEVIGEFVTSTAILVQSDCLVGRIEKVASKKLVKEVFSIMRNDPVAKVARNDALICMLGNMWLQKNVGNQLNRGKYTSQVMRLAAKLLMNLRKVQPTKNNEDLCWYLHPENFESIVKATLITAASDMDDENDLAKPSNAIKLGFDLKRMLNCKIGLAIMENSGKGDAHRKQAEDLMKLIEIFWGSRVAKLARVLLEERRFNKRNELPLPEDLLALNNHLEAELGKLDLSDVTTRNYYRVAKVVQTKLLVYNRRRTGELEATK